MLKTGDRLQGTLLGEVWVVLNVMDDGKFEAVQEFTNGTRDTRKVTLTYNSLLYRKLPAKT